MSSKLILLLVAVFTPTALSVTCTYSLSGTNYVCYLIEQVVNSENDFGVIDGIHVGNLGNQNVTGVISSNSTIRVFPSLLIDAFINLNSVTITNSMMTSFVSSITNCEHLDSISVDRSDLVNIPQRVFERCTRLRNLSLMNSKIATVHVEAFIGLSSLQRLDLQRNEIGSLNESIFRSLTNLTVINLSNNELNKMERLPSLFATNVNLQYGWLDHNNLTNLGNDLFLNCINLVGISFIGNRLTALENGLFSTLADLNEFELGHNQIQNLPIFTGVGKLARLDVTNNEIKEIKAANFEDLTSLISLTLSYNLIEKIENGSFIGMSYLRELSLANNKLAVLERDTFIGLDRLDILDLSNNQLSYLNTDSFSEQPVVRRFILNDNQIWGIQSNILEKFAQLQRMDLLRNECMDSVVTIYRYQGESFASPSLDVCINSGIGNRTNFVLIIIALSFSFLKWF
ncbi:slit homolog 2 protein-like [Bradysia coprophila]|uniref:slit homolog 2 protein-like n=1 Tax=Bradysia coprophila TaxID=38358 RepID=UPI00187DCFC2|nr:slit homolog 2 protein-like [Bradysia coprophila]